MRRWLVTGGSGFIGRRVVRLLQEAGEDVHALAFSPGSLPPDPTSHYVDLLDLESASRLVGVIRPSHIITLAWTTEHMRFWTDPRNEDWCAATTGLINHFLTCGGEAVVGVGSCAEYLWNGQTCREDATPIAPATPYGRAKAMLGRTVADACRFAGARFAWGRIFFAYGTGEPSEKLFPSLVRAACSRQMIRIREPRRRLDFIHADDVAGALVALGMKEAHGPFNIASGSAISVTALADLIFRAAGSATFENDETQTPAPDVTADIAKIRFLGWEPRTDISSGVAEAIHAVSE